MDQYTVIIKALEDQRNAALTQQVNLQVMLAAKDEEIAELKKQLEEKEHLDESE